MKIRRKIRWITLGTASLLNFNILYSIVFSPNSTVNAQPLSSEAICITSSIPKSIRKDQNFNALLQGDRCYKQGDLISAEKWYRLAKVPLNSSRSRNFVVPEPVYEADELSRGGQVFWRNYKLYEDQPNTELSKFVPLFLLIKKEPNFIPGYAALADTFKKSPDWCTQKAHISTCEGNPQNRVEVLEEATARFPNDAELTKAKVDALAENKMYLEASIAARQFALFFPDYPDADKFSVLADKYMKRYRSNLRTSLIAQTVLGCGIGIALTERGLSACNIAFFLIEGESTMGSQLISAKLQRYQRVDDPIVNQYINDIADRLIPLMGRSDFEYEFHVVHDDNLNATAYPGGKIIINTGAILKTNSEAELAGLLSHEIAHAVLSHGYQKAAQSNFVNSISQIIPLGGFAQLITSSYSRSKEKQADILGTKVLASADYAADGLRNLTATLNKEHGENEAQRSTTERWYATHPPTLKRIHYLENLIQMNGYNQFAFEGVERHREIQKRLGR